MAEWSGLESEDVWTERTLERTGVVPGAGVGLPPSPRSTAASDQQVEFVRKLHTSSPTWSPQAHAHSKPEGGWPLVIRKRFGNGWQLVTKQRWRGSSPLGVVFRHADAKEGAEWVTNALCPSTSRPRSRAWCRLPSPRTRCRPPEPPAGKTPRCVVFLTPQSFSAETNSPGGGVRRRGLQEVISQEGGAPTA